MVEKMYPQIVSTFKEQLDKWNNDDLKPIEFYNIKPLFGVYANLITITLFIFMCEIIKRLINSFVDSLDFTSFLC